MALQSLSHGYRQDFNTESLGYYRTDDETVRRIAGMIKPRDSETANETASVLFDPCCGEGLALAQLAGSWFQDGEHPNPGCKTYGVEYDAGRFLEASTRIDHVLHGDALNDTWMSTSWAGLMLFNPPYGDVGEGRTSTRLEAQFWEQYATRIMRGGLMVAILPRSAFLKAPGLTRAISHYFAGERVAVYNAAVDTYKQVVIIGHRRTDPKAGQNKDLHDRLVAVAQGIEILDALPETVPETGIFQFPPGREPESFEAMRLTDESVGLALTHETGEALQAVETDLAAQRMTHVRHPSVMPLRQGHIPTLLAAGGLDGIVSDENGSYLVKGSVKRIAIEHVEDTEIDDAGGRAGGKVSRTTTIRYQWQTQVIAWDLTPGNDYALVTIE